jgi:hypothetical protein
MVQVVNQRVVSGWHAGKLYVQVMPPPEEESESESKPADKKAVAKKVKEQKPLVEPFTKEKAIARLFQQAKQHAVVVDQSLLDQVIKDQTNVSYPVTGGMTTAQVITSARHVDNHLPKGATWDGSTTLMVTAEEFDAMRSGVILPKKEAAATEPPKKSEKPSSTSPKTKSAPLPAT